MVSLIPHPVTGSGHSSLLWRTLPSRMSVVALCLFLLGIAALSWSLHGWLGGPPPPDYLGKGRVVGLYPPPSSLHATRPVIIIYHEPIAGLMDEAMSMPFIVASAKLFQGLRPGDSIAFGLKSTPDALLVVSIERIGADRQKDGAP